jgi:hypothetical protein
MARFRIIVLDKVLAETNAFNVLLWADVPVARQRFYANDTIAASAWMDAIPADVDALKSGAVVEQVHKISRSQGGNMAQMQGDAQAAWQAFQDTINTTNLWNRYGSTWDGTTWVSDGVA